MYKAEPFSFIHPYIQIHHLQAVYDAQTVNFEFNFSKIRLSDVTRLQKAKGLEQIQPIAKILSDGIVSWDVFEDNETEQSVPITYDVLMSELPSNLVREMFLSVANKIGEIARS